MRRVGRPREKVEPAEAQITKRVRELVDEVHGGNVLEASNVTGVPAATLRALYNGKSTNPGLKTLKALAEPYGLAPGWFAEEGTQFSPRMGLDLALGVRQPDGNFFTQHRIGMPWSSWPMPGVFRRLQDYLVRQEGPERPVIGKVDPTDPMTRPDFDSAVGKFLLAPLLDLEGAFRVSLMPIHSRDIADPVKVQRMKALGQFWQDALEPWLNI